MRHLRLTRLWACLGKVVPTKIPREPRSLGLTQAEVLSEEFSESCLKG